MRPEHNSNVLVGLDGGNPLGFLAAVGTLRSATLALGDLHIRPCMQWRKTFGGWRPEIQFVGEECLTVEAVLPIISKWLKDAPGKIAFESFESVRPSQEKFRAVAIRANENISDFNDRAELDFLAAFGSEAVEENGCIANCAIRANRSHEFLRFAHNLISETEEKHFRKTLLEVWLYDDPIETHSMRWDPREDIRYALRWRKPEGDPARKFQGTMWGANRLAIEALPLMPSVPVKGRLETTGVSVFRGEGICWTWPIWENFLGLETVHSLLSLQELQKRQPDREKLLAMGIAEVYRSQRISQGKYRNFTTAISV